MSRRFGRGSGVPGGWNTVGVRAGNKRRAAKPTAALPVAVSSNLVSALVTDNRWQVRDQGHRATCNAFAVIAAEELASWIEDPSKAMVPLSEEYLYKSMREKPLEMVEVDQATVAESGATFLFQAKAVLESEGLVLAKGLSYDDDPSLPNNYTVTVEPPKENRLKPSEHRFVHNISRKPEVGSDIDWINPLPFPLLSQLFHQQLARQRPIAACFAILEGPGSNVFESAGAQSRGDVEYPNPKTAEGLSPTDGHALCIVGYQPGKKDPEAGWFVFRNSYGTARFANNAKLDKAPPVAPAPGYGTISAADVDLYCWEYLYRE